MERFVEKASRIERSRYLRTVAEQGGTKLDFAWDKNSGITISTNFPDEEAVDAIVLTARMFVQNNDHVSFNNLAKILDDPGVSSAWKARFTRIREHVNQFLDTPSAMKINDKPQTHRAIFDVVLYGHLAHTNAAKATMYADWAEHPLALALVEADFHLTLTQLVKAVSQLSVYTKMELAGESI